MSNILILGLFDIVCQKSCLSNWGSNSTNVPIWAMWTGAKCSPLPRGFGNIMCCYLFPGGYQKLIETYKTESVRLSGDHTYKVAKGLGVYDLTGESRRWVCLWFLNEDFSYCFTLKNVNRPSYNILDRIDPSICISKVVSIAIHMLKLI